MKKLEDYIHLYIGCQVLITDEELVKDLIESGGDGRGVLTGLHGEYGPEFAANEGHHTSESPEYTWHMSLILRPLSAITENEYLEIYDLDIDGMNYKDIDQSDRYKVNLAHTWMEKKETFRYLLSKGFDIFGLKDAGLAVYETEKS